MVLVGPTVGLVPDAFLRRGVNVLGGVRVTAPDAFLNVLTEGGSGHHFFGRRLGGEGSAGAQVRSANIAGGVVVHRRNEHSLCRESRQTEMRLQSLPSVYGWFAEAFHTLDLKEAKDFAW